METRAELMFTGIINETGLLQRNRDGRITIAMSPEGECMAGLRLGDSVAVNGCCLTALDIVDGSWSADLSPETVSRTTLGSLVEGSTVNVERPLSLSSLLGGHLVQGHVDTVGTVVRPCPDLVVRAPQAVISYLVPKGSITVDGVSLTVVDVNDDSFSVAVIPHTASATTLGQRHPGDQVNLEVDVIAKYVERLIAPRLI